MTVIGYPSTSSSWSPGSSTSSAGAYFAHADPSVVRLEAEQLADDHLAEDDLGRVAERAERDVLGVLLGGAHHHQVDLALLLRRLHAVLVARRCAATTSGSSPAMNQSSSVTQARAR